METVTELNNLAREKHVIIKWIKAHVGFPGNEEADRLAKEGASNGHREMDCPLPPKSDTTQRINNIYQREWCERWKNQNEARQTKVWFPLPDNIIMKKLFNYSRNELGLLIQWITGHNRLRRHLTITKESDDNQCRMCNEEEETAWHLTGECPALWQERRNIFGETFLKQPPSWNPNQLVLFLKRTKCDLLMSNQEADK